MRTPSYVSEFFVCLFKRGGGAEKKVQQKLLSAAVEKFYALV